MYQLLSTDLLKEKKRQFATISNCTFIHKNVKYSTYV